MKKILLVCSAGMSTSLLVIKMNAAAMEMGESVKVQATAEADIEENLDGVDILLLGPQVRYLESKLRARVPAGVPIELINSVDYGTMNGAKVLSFALAKIDEKKG